MGELKFIQRLRLTAEPGELSTTTDSAGFIISLNPFHHFAIPSDQLRSKVLTVCEGCQPHLEESYTVCSRTATGDAWPSGILVSLPLPAEERG